MVYQLSISFNTVLISEKNILSVRKGGLNWNTDCSFQQQYLKHKLRKLVKWKLFCVELWRYKNAWMKLYKSPPPPHLRSSPVFTLYRTRESNELWWIWILISHPAVSSENQLTPPGEAARHLPWMPWREQVRGHYGTVGPASEPSTLYRYTILRSPAG